MEDSAKISARMEINMGKTVFMFPGQGAQYIGMAKDFYDAIPECREVFEEASEASGLDIAALCFEENDKINITEYTQICMLTAEAAILRALEVKGYKADVTAGLSLGEYGALIACGALSRKDAFALVRSRWRRGASCWESSSKTTVSVSAKLPISFAFRTLVPAKIV